MNQLNIEEIRKSAENELYNEMFRQAVDEYKIKLKTKKSFWDKIFPYKIMVIKKGELK